MKLFWTIWLIVLPFSSFAQFFFDFEQGLPAGWTQDPPGRWDASTRSPLRGKASLKHIYDNPASGHDRISFSPGTPLFSSTLSWTFLLRHGYPPSSANNWAVFLLADGGAPQMIPGSNIRGIAAGVNLTGSDDRLKLWYLHDKKTDILLSTGLNWQNTIDTSAALLRILRTPEGIWKMFMDTSLSGNRFTLLGEAALPDTFPARNFGIRYEYSSSRDRLLWIDDIHIDGKYVQDTLPPVVRDFRFPAADQLVLTFSEDVLFGQASFTADHSIGTPDGITTLAGDSILLTFGHTFSEDTVYGITLGGVQDLSGNILPDTLLKVSFHLPHYQEVQINEIMADPSPPLGLPEAEYLELYNVSPYRIWLDHCSLAFDEETRELPLTDLPPGSRIILTDQGDASLLRPYGRVLGLRSMPALLNGGMSLTLTDGAGNLLSHISYTSGWYKDPYKAEGGWSLEQIDPFHPCPRESNWQAASAWPGGTPGTKNSVRADNPEMMPAEITNLYLVDDHTLRILFSGPYDPASLSDPAHFRVDHQTGHPVKVQIFSPAYRQADLSFSRSFRPGIIYILSLQDLKDCSGNEVITAGHDRFARTLPADSSDLVINEVLYNPPPEGVDFVEIYNRSQKVIDLSGIFLAQRDDETFSLTSIQRICRDPQPFFPGEYKVLTTDPRAVQDEFFYSDPKAFILMNKLPSLPDDRGNILLADTSFHVLDELHYEDDMQFPLLRETEGVSLERISFDGSTQDRLNWHSAASDKGYGTPGLQNSQYDDGSSGDAHITTDPEIVSPDNDGYNDVLHIHYHFDEPGYVATVMIFDANGILLRTLVNNYLLGRRGEITWDGLDTEEKRLPSGIYLVFIRIFNLKGEVKNYKRTCVIAGRR